MSNFVGEFCKVFANLVPVNVYWSQYKRRTFFLVVIFALRTLLDKLIAFWSGAFCLISLMLCFIIDLYLLRFSFPLFTMTSFLNLLLLLGTDAVGCMLSRLIFRAWRDFIFCSKMTTFSATISLISLLFSLVVLFLILLRLLLRLVLRVLISFSRALMISSSVPVDALWSILLQTILSLLLRLQRNRILTSCLSDISLIFYRSITTAWWLCTTFFQF